MLATLTKRTSIVTDGDPSARPPEAGDGDLVRRTLGGDYEAFEVLVGRYTKLAGGVAFGVTGDYHGAADVVQEAFIKAHRALESLEDPDRFGAWLRHIVRTSAVDWLRKQRHRSISIDQADGEHNPIVDPDEAADPVAAANRNELREQVLQEVAALPEHYREVVVLKYLEGRSYEGIAELTGLTVEAVESRLHRARGRLRKKFRKLVGG